MKDISKFDFEFKKVKDELRIDISLKEEFRDLNKGKVSILPEDVRLYVESLGYETKGIISGRRLSNYSPVEYCGICDIRLKETIVAKESKVKRRSKKKTNSRTSGGDGGEE